MVLKSFRRKMTGREIRRIFPTNYFLNTHMTGGKIWKKQLKLNGFITTHMLHDDEIYLVGHGMGGLISREYLRNYAGTQFFIKKQILNRNSKSWES